MSSTRREREGRGTPWTPVYVYHRFLDSVYFSLLVTGVRENEQMIRKQRKRNESNIWEETIPKRKLTRDVQCPFLLAFSASEREWNKEGPNTKKSCVFEFFLFSLRLAITDIDVDDNATYAIIDRDESNEVRYSSMVPCMYLPSSYATGRMWLRAFFTGVVLVEFKVSVSKQAKKPSLSYVGREEMDSCFSLVRCSLVLHVSCYW